MQDYTSRCVSRRTLIKTTTAFIASTLLPDLAQATALPARHLYNSHSRSLHLVNPHTGDSLKTVYWEKGNYHSEALKDIAYVMRDQHTQDMHAVDPKLLDILYALHHTLGSDKPFEMICGYRTPRTNAYVYKHEHGVGRNSYHMYGRAIDIRMTDRSAGQIQHAAWALQLGGVGYYPKRGMVHIDTGGVRRW